MNQPVTGPFSFCRVFDGSEPASHWLKRLEFELQGSKKDGIITPEQYLSSVALLLVGDAANWADSSHEITTILAGSHTSQSLNRFLSLFKEHFPTQVAEVVSTCFPEEVNDLRQGADESLTSYYQRTTQIVSRFGARDRLPEGPPLSILESSMLDMIRSAFLKGLSDPELRYEAIRGAVSGDGASLRGTFMSTKQVYDARLMLKDIESKEFQSREAMFYKDFVLRPHGIQLGRVHIPSDKAGNNMPEQRLPDKFLLPNSNSQQSIQQSSQQSSPRSAIGSKSVTWSIPDSMKPSPRAILKPGSWYTIVGSITIDSGWVDSGWVDSGWVDSGWVDFGGVDVDQFVG